MPFLLVAGWIRCSAFIRGSESWSLSFAGYGEQVYYRTIPPFERIAMPSEQSLKTQEYTPRTDVGTVTLHWASAIAFLVSLVTGIRIAADALSAPFSKWLAPVLPQGEIFSWHILAGLAVFFCGSAYVVYVSRSRLTERVSLKKTRILAMRAPARLKWGAVNVLLHW